MGQRSGGLHWRNASPQNMGKPARNSALPSMREEPFPAEISLQGVSITFKYVNMADINRKDEVRSRAPRHRRGTVEGAATSFDPALVEHVELLFFAYRDFTADPDAVLSRYGFGRAHHRVLHFVNRNPGLRVANLLEILKITKQSLARVLKQLIGDGYIAQHAGEDDRRERLLYLTDQGAALAEQLTALQVERLEAALAVVGGDAKAVLRQFLLAMISPEERPQVEELVRPWARDAT